MHADEASPAPSVARTTTTAVLPMLQPRYGVVATRKVTRGEYLATVTVRLSGLLRQPHRGTSPRCRIHAKTALIHDRIRQRHPPIFLGIFDFPAEWRMPDYRVTAGYSSPHIGSSCCTFV